MMIGRRSSYHPRHHLDDFQKRKMSEMQSKKEKAMSTSITPELRADRRRKCAMIILAYIAGAITAIAGSVIYDGMSLEQWEVIPRTLMIASILVGAIGIIILKLFNIQPKT